MKAQFIPFQSPHSALILSAKEVIKILQQKGYIAYIVGGATRDMLLQRAVKEVDIATSALPQEIMNLFPIHKAVGAHFGVVLVTWQGFTFDIATFRTDGIYQDGRHPDQVTFSSPEQDVLRRDFTINGLFYDPVNQTIIDWVNGIEHIHAKKIVTIGDPKARFAEDYLRILRCIRFFKQLSPFGFSITPEVLGVIKEYSSHLKKVSKERIREELVKTLDHQCPLEVLNILFETGCSRHIFPAASRLSEDSISLFFKLQQNTHTPFCLFYLAITIDWANQSYSHSQMEHSFLFTNKELQLIIDTISVMSWRLLWSTWSIGRKKRELRLKDISMILNFLIQWEKIFHTSHVFDDIQQYFQEVERTLYPPRWITGDTLIKKGLKPSPQFRFILEEIENQQLEGTVHSQQEALLLLERLVQKENQE